MPLSQVVMPILIPGAYDRSTLTYRQAGSMGGPAFGSTGLPPGDRTMSAETVMDRELEGGGGVSQRPRQKVASSTDSRSATPEGATGRFQFGGVDSWFTRSRRLVQSWFTRPAVAPHL